MERQPNSDLVPHLTLFDTTGAWLGNSILGVQKFAFHEFDPKILAFTDMKTFFSSKSVGSILHLSEIYGFCRTHRTNGTHSNYAPDLMFVPAKIRKNYLLSYRAHVILLQLFPPCKIVTVGFGCP